jgi:hypothetical protein
MSQRPLSPVAINVAVWTGLVVLVAGFGFFSVLRPSSIARHARSTQASIVGVVPEEHQSFDYRYRVGDRTYFGRSTAGNADRSFESLRVGDTLSIFYDSTHPEESTAGPPDMPRIEAIGGLIAACVIVPFALMYFMHQARMLPYWKLFTVKA